MNVSVNFNARAVKRRSEDERDLRDYEEALAEFRKNPVTHTLDEIERELGLI